MYLDIGTKAKNFTLQNQDGKEVSLSDFKGKKIVLYFYPKDNTPGCTREAQGFKEHIDEFTKKNAVVIGISKDSVKSHNNFSCKYELPFNILSDESTEIIDAYGAWQLKKNYGREYMGIVRSTYIIDEKGNVAKTYKVAKVDGHVEQVLADLDNI